MWSAWGPDAWSVSAGAGALCWTEPRMATGVSTEERRGPDLETLCERRNNGMWKLRSAKQGCDRAGRCRDPNIALGAWVQVVLREPELNCGVVDGVYQHHTRARLRTLQETKPPSSTDLVYHPATPPCRTDSRLNPSTCRPSYTHTHLPQPRNPKVYAKPGLVQCPDSKQVL
jgi:hypothetical protein